MFAEAAIAIDRSRKAEKRYEDYKRSQEARIYNHPGHDVRQILTDRRQTLYAEFHEENKRLKRIITDLENLPSHHLSDVVAYNEHNHVSEETLAQESRMAAIIEGEKRLNERHDHVDRTLTTLQAQLEELTKEKQAREIIRDLPPPVDPNEMAVEEAVTAHQANTQRLIAVEVRCEPIGFAVRFSDYIRSSADISANHHSCGGDSPQGWTYPTPRRFVPNPRLSISTVAGVC